MTEQPPDAPYGYCQRAACGRPLTVARTLYPSLHDACAARLGLVQPLEAPGEAPGSWESSWRGQQRRAQGWRQRQSPVSDVELPDADPSADESRSVSRRERMLTDLGDVCYFCGAGLTADGPNVITREHLTPTSKGGARNRLNEVAACWRCNSSKGDMTEQEFTDWIKRVAAWMGLA